MRKPRKTGPQQHLNEDHRKPLADPPPNIRCGDLGWPDVVTVVVIAVMEFAFCALPWSPR